MKLYGMPGRTPGFLLFLLMALSALLIVPCSVSGATPPLLPFLTVSVSNDTLSPNEDLEVSAAWNRDASSYRPPTSVDVRIYSVSSGSLVAGYTIPEDGRAAPDGNTRQFRGMIASSELPAGRLLLVVIDPVSGADVRVRINVTEPGPDFPGIRMQGYVDAVFAWVAAVLLVVLGAGLGLLLGGREGRRCRCPAPPHVRLHAVGGDPTGVGGRSGARVSGCTPAAFYHRFT